MGSMEPDWPISWPRRLTHGGFYKHFESKEQVVDESLALAFESMVEEWQRTLSASPGSRGLDSAIGGYLSAEYRDNVAGGCPFVALGGEVARSPDVVREDGNDWLPEVG